MTISEYTQKIDHLRWLIESKKERILALEAIATNTTAAMTGMPHNPSSVQSRMADALLKKLELENSIREDEASLQALKEVLGEAIERVSSPKHQAILYKRYIRNMTIDEIAVEISYSERTAKRLISEANRMLEEVLAAA